MITVREGRNRNSFARRLAIVLAINVAVALMIFALYQWMLLDREGNWVAIVIIISLVFADPVGSLSSLTLPYVAPHFERRSRIAKWTLLLGTVLLITVVGCLLSISILIAIDLLPSGRFWWLFYTNMLVAAPIAFTIAVSKSIYEGVRDKLETTTLKLAAKELEEERARKLAVEARLSSLESRVHPHFLFNTLNSISALIQEDPVLAERMVERLSALLRFSLDSNQRRTVPLSQEMKIVVDYLEIEKARFGSRLRYSVEIPPELGLVEVPPLSLQTLVENSVKHSVSQRRDGGEIRISARITGGRLNVEVSDDGPGFTHEAITAGHGLDNLQSRLEVLFDSDASLHIGSRDGRSVVTFSAPAKEAVGTVV